MRPLIKMTGETGFNEVIFEDLEVDDSYRLDELGKGWQVAMTTLLHERGAGELVTPRSGGMQSSSSHTSNSGTLIELARNTRRNGGSAAEDPIIRDRIMQQMIREAGMAANQRRGRVTALQDHPMRLALQNKLLASEIAQDTAGIAMDIEGAAASLYLGDTAAPSGGQWPMSYMNSFGFTIAAGPSEVQRKILRARGLGRAKSK